MWVVMAMFHFTMSESVMLKFCILLLFWDVDVFFEGYEFLGFADWKLMVGMGQLLCNCLKR